MYLEHFHLSKSPFPEQSDPKVFFPHGGRGKILRNLLSDISARKALIKLIGAEGSGKTLLCKLLMAQMPEEYDVVYLVNPLGSFDDLLRIICLDLGMDPKTDLNANMVEELNHQLALREEKNRFVIIVIDEAEKLFLATLERLIRILNEQSAKGLLQVLLTGRPGLNVNLNQLTVYCSSIDIHAGYFLEPLNREETENYLNYRLQASGLDEKEHENIFSEGAVSKIYESAQGNLRLTNILAEEALQNSCTEKSFLVLLEHVSSKSGDQGNRRKQRTLPKRVSPLNILPKVRIDDLLDQAGIKQFVVKYKRQIGGFFCIMVAFSLIIMLSGGHETEEPTAKPTVEKTDIQFEQIDKMAKNDLNAKQDPEVYKERQPVDEPVAIAPPPPIEDREEDQPVFPEQDTKSEQILTEPRDANQTYEERLRSSAAWIAGAYRGATTIQLMKLMSDQGEENLKKLLEQDEYYSIKDNLFFLTKKTSPPTLFVFYGSFESMDAARDYRNSMPLFLRKHHPYALPISEALKKIED